MSGFARWHIGVLGLVALLAACGGGGGGGGGGSPDWFYHWRCNGDAQCLATNPSGQPSGTLNEGPVQVNCTQLQQFAAINWGPAAVDACDNSPAAALISVGGTVSNLTGTGLVLQNNGGNNRSITGNGIFTFTSRLADGASYNVGILTQPSGQTCTIANGSGTIANANVTNVTLTCFAGTSTFTVGGNVSGLTGAGLVLQNNGGDNLGVGAIGGFTFATRLPNTAPYSVSVLTQPAGQSCTVTNASGTIPNANVTNVGVTCGAPWTSRSSGTTNILRAVAWSASDGFSAMGDSGTHLTSADGVSWTNNPAGAAASVSFLGVTSDGTQFVAVGAAGAIFTSPTGAALTVRTPAAVATFRGVAWSGAVFVIVGDSAVIQTSPDGITWTSRTSGLAANVGNSLTAVTWSGAEFVAVGLTGNIVTSPDGTTWTPRTSGTTKNLNAVAWSGSQFVAAGNSGTVLTSTDGSSWTDHSVTSLASTNLNAVASSGSQFAAVGAGGVIVISSDGANWTIQPSGTTNDLDGIVWNGTHFTAVGAGGTILTSP